MKVTNTLFTCSLCGDPGVTQIGIIGKGAQWFCRRCEDNIEEIHQENLQRKKTSLISIVIVSEEGIGDDEAYYLNLHWPCVPRVGEVLSLYSYSAKVFVPWGVVQVKHIFTASDCKNPGDWWLDGDSEIHVHVEPIPEEM